MLPPHTTEDETLADLLFASTGIEAEIVERADRLTLLPGLSVPVASVGHLIAMRILSHDADRRPRDADDLLALIAIARTGDLDEAPAALTLITARGCNRGKDLDAELERFLLRTGHGHIHFNSSH